jgi:hypothetical protein
MRRMFVAVAAAATLAVPAAAFLATSSPATASSSVSCKKVTGSISGTITMKSCTPKDKNNKSLSGIATQLATGGTLTWSPSNGTTIVGNINTTSPGQGGCKNGSTEYDTTGTVTGGTSTYTHVNDTLTSRTCVTSKGKLSLVKGTVATL